MCQYDSAEDKVGGDKTAVVECPRCGERLSRTAPPTEGSVRCRVCGHLIELPKREPIHVEPSHSHQVDKKAVQETELCPPCGVKTHGPAQECRNYDEFLDGNNLGAQRSIRAFGGTGKDQIHPDCTPELLKPAALRCDTCCVILPEDGRFCPSCGRNIASNHVFRPSRGERNGGDLQSDRTQRQKESTMGERKQSTNSVVALLGLIVLGASVWFYFGGGLEQQTHKDMGRIYQQVAEDAVKQYEITKRSGNAIDAYVHAGLVAAAYLQAKDEYNYQKWKMIEVEEGRRAGISRP